MSGALTLVVVWWLDPRFFWDLGPDERATLELYRTSGELRYEDDDVIEVGHEASEESGDWRGVTVIPKAWLVDVFRVPAPASGTRLTRKEGG